jgi:hypothetical protein
MRMAAVARERVSLSRQSLRKEWLLLMLITALILGPVLAVMSRSATPDDPLQGSDYPLHAQYAQAIMERTPAPFQPTPHILFQVLTIAFKQLFALPTYILAAALVGLLCYLVTATLLYQLLLDALPETARHARWIAAAGALALLVVSPILVTVFNRDIYMGYISLNTIHNPTSVLTRPTALMLFMLLARLFQTGRLARGTMLIAAVLTILCITAKPNYILCLVPAVVIILGIRLWRHQPLFAPTVLVGLLIPALLFMALDFQIAFGAETNSSIALAPFRFIAVYDPSPVSWVVKFFASIAFPLVVIADRHARRDTLLRFAWLVLAFGIAQMYGLAETGYREQAGNWIWGAQLGLFILFAVTLAWCLRHWSDLSAGRRRLYEIVFGLHLVSGIFFVLFHLLADKATFWSWIAR